jgi:hypothetical protein
VPNRLTAVAIAVALLAAGCGGTSRRAVVGRYIDSVNAVDAKLAEPLRTISLADHDFAQRHSDTSSVLVRLRSSEARIHVLARRLATVPAPPEARTLRRLLLELLGHEQSLVGEVEKMAVFIPAFNRALAPLAAADAQLRPTLARKTTPAMKAAALARFRSRVGAAEARVRTLRPPPSSTPTWSQQLATLERVGTAAGALETALLAKQASAIPKLVHEFDVAASSSQALPAQRAEIAAIVAYDKRIKSLDGLGTRIAREEARLERTVN